MERSFLELRDPVFRYLRAMGCRLSLAEEITQECFLRLHRAFRVGLQLNDVRAWVFRVARNLFIDSRREYQRYWSTGTDEIEPQELPYSDSPLDPEQQVLENERVRLIEQEISRLPKLQRECVRLRVQGLRYHEIAVVLDVSMATAVDCVRRAVKRLGRRFQF